MSLRRVLQPPEQIDPGPWSIFLGGPIQGAPLWQQEAIEIIHDIDPTITLANPRRDYLPEEFDYLKQVGWEKYNLGRLGVRDCVGVRLFWLAPQAHPTPGRAYGQTTRWELSKYVERSKHIPDTTVVVGMTKEGFGNERYIRLELEEEAPYIPICNSLAETCAKAIQLLGEKLDTPARD